jgi:hypothetical protein
LKLKEGLVKMSTVTQKLIESDEEINLDPEALSELSEWLELSSGVDQKSALDLFNEAMQAQGISKSAGAKKVRTKYRGIYESRRLRIKRTTALAVLATLISAPLFASTFPPSPSWQQLTTWLAGLLGVNTVQLVGLFETLFETSKLELSHDEERVVQTIVSVPQREESIRRQITARFPEFTNREIDNILERLTSHGFLIAGRDAEGARTYRVNLKWKKISPQS